MDTIQIADLPRELTEDDAVGLIYRDDLDWIEDRLRQGLSVLIECDKQLTLYLYKALRRRLKRRGAQRISCRLISGHIVPDPDNPIPINQTLMQRILQQLQEAVFDGETDRVVVLTHLDILTTTTRSGLGADAREAAALLYENPVLTLLAFQDPSFEIPEVIRSVFPARRQLIGIPRDRLPSIILQREARKLAVHALNPYSLYRYLSGVNAVRARQILSHFSDRADFDPANPDTAAAIHADIRQMTLTGDAELPRVDLHSDIGGYEEVKARIVTEILDLLTLRRTADAETGRTIDEIVPKGIIFHGPPGTGKTFFAKAIATALDATITIVSGPELKSRWVGESEANLRRIFASARRSAPAIIVFDELDSFASARGTYSGSGVEHSMVNQLLTEMDGFRKEELVFVVGTTNFMESLDPALLRPGRFELGIEIPYPDDDARRAILDIYRRKFRLNMPDDVLEHTVRLTSGHVDASRGIRFSGDHLYAAMRGLMREVLRRGDRSVALTTADVEAVLDRRSKAPVRLSDAEERCVAIHEAGHALCAWLLPNCPTIEHISIATGQEQTLGYVMQAVKERRYVTTRAELLEDICVLLGGQAAEALMLEDISVGAWSDLQRATEIARMMVEELGMSELGPRNFHRDGERALVSESAAARIDAEIDALLLSARERTKTLLADNKDMLSALTDLLLQQKEASLADLKRLFGEP